MHILLMNITIVIEVIKYIQFENDVIEGIFPTLPLTYLKTDIHNSVSSKSSKSSSLIHNKDSLPYFAGLNC